MADIDWSVVCDFAYLDRNRRLCLLGVTREVVVPAVPHTVEQLVMVARLVNLSAADQVRLCFTLVSDHPIVTDVNHVAIEVADQYAFARVNGLTFPEEGTYVFELTVDGRTVAQRVAVVSATAGSDERYVVH